MQDTTKTNTKIRRHLISQKAATTDWYHSPEKRYCQLQQNKWLHPREILQMVFWNYQIFCSNVPILVTIWNILIDFVESFFIDLIPYHSDSPAINQTNREANLENTPSQKRRNT